MMLWSTLTQCRANERLSGREPALLLCHEPPLAIDR